ncbi:hypothetical protein AVEN_161322-1 [Araneus ventricosus]|uniref:Uncharacterized protein n=1 Tax=Araneus ventricosus TaxID=182803 RepID=A0A4Y2VTF6_ARAVE|nr:hypothetical protein AVEN_161322-1 [Araneus ventricosus]
MSEIAYTYIDSCIVTDMLVGTKKYSPQTKALHHRNVSFHVFPYLMVTVPVAPLHRKSVESDANQWTRRKISLTRPTGCGVHSADALTVAGYRTWS